MSSKSSEPVLPGRSRNNEATDSIAFAVTANFLSAFSAQKSHVKPQSNNIRVAC
jgi:hypothetical protein